MSTVLEDGTYTFTNVAFPPSQPTLSNGNPLGNIVGLNTAQPQLWIVRNSGGVTTIRSGISDITSFSSALASVQGASVVGSPNTFSWIVRRVPGSPDAIYIATPGDALTWNLTAGTNESPITLQPRRTEIPSAAQWTPNKLS